MADDKQVLPLPQVWRVHASTGATVKVAAHDIDGIGLGLTVEYLCGGASCRLSRDEAGEVLAALTEALGGGRDG